MRRQVLKWVAATQVHHLARLGQPHRPIILAYHGLTDRRDEAGIGNCQGKHLPIDVFRRHMEYIGRHYRVVPLDDLVSCYRRGAAPPPRSVVITFDDGYHSVFELGFPLLREFGMPATAFLVTNFVARQDWLWPDRLEYALGRTSAPALEVEIGGTTHQFDLSSRAATVRADALLRSLLKRLPQDAVHGTVADIERQLSASLAAAAPPPALYRPMGWPEVRAMMASGLMSIGSHTASHLILTRCTAERAAEELALSRRTIEAATGVPCTLFCYPNGRAGCFDGGTKALLQRHGYTCGLTTIEGLNGPDTDVFELRRLSIVDRGHLDRFKLTLSGVMGRLDTVQTALRRVAGQGASNG